MSTILVTFLCLFFLSNSRADSLDMPSDIGASRNEPIIKTPKRGMTMEQVELEFGQPSDKFDPVGDPPITRWVYNEFTVHFESEFVIHAVIKK